jgi:hypothetical protein
MISLKKYILVGLLVASSTLTALAQNANNFLAAAGSPPNPKVPISWNRYHDYAGLVELYKKLAAAHPDLITMESVGKSYNGRDIYVLTVSDRKKGIPVDRKPAIYIDGGIHANEIQTSEFALYVAWYLAEMHHAGNAFVRELLEDKTFYIAPSISPDSRENFFHAGNTQHSSRTGQVPVDNDRDGQVDEDDFDDLDGDGHITMMRRKSPYGEYIVDPNDPRRMIRVAPGQKGEYELLGNEGLDNDGDGLVNEDGIGGYDPNRDWGWGWQPNFIQNGAYKYPFSLPENRAIGNFIMSKRNISAGQNFHNNGGMILRGPGAEEDVNIFNQSDIRVYDALGKKGEEMIPGYRYIVTYKDLYSVYGGQLDWMHATQGIYAFCNELWNTEMLFLGASSGDSQTQQYAADRLLLMEDSFVPWKKYNHPTYGEVEIGGFKKTYGRLHPGFLLEADAHRNAAFTIYHAYHTPKLSVDSIEVKEVGNGLKEVTAVIKNERIIPTNSAWSVMNKLEVPDLVSLTGGTVVSGMIVQNRDLGLTTEQKRDPANIKVNTIPGNGYVTVRWLVKGGKEYTITVDSKKGGIATAKTK